MAVPPYNDNRNLPSAGTAQLRPGRVTDRSRTGGSAPTGVPSQPMVQYTLNSPAAVVTDRFLTSTATTTAAKTYTLTETSMPDTYVGSGGDSLVTFYVARNVICTLSGSATAEVIVSGVDFQGQAQTETFTWTAESGVKNGVKTFAYLTGATSTSDTNRNLTIGFGNVFGLPYPCYSNQGLCSVLYDADGADYAATPLMPGGIARQIDNLLLKTFTNADGTTLAGAASTSNLGLVTGVVGTATPSLQTTDLKNTSAAPTARWIQYQLPANYIPGSAITLRANAGMLTTVASNSAATTVDFAAYKNGAGSDLVTTAATSANFLTAANYDFVVTPTGLVAGDWLDILVTFTVTDVGTGTAVIGKINKVSVLSTVVPASVSAYAAFTPGDPTSTTADRYGTVLLGTDNTASGTLVPDGTADYAIWFLCNDTEGVLNSGGTGPIYDIT